MFRALALILSPVAAVADGDPRWVAQDPNPKALMSHFGMAEADCYDLSDPAAHPGLRIEIFHVFNPETETPQDTRTNYDIEILTDSDGQIINATGQCHTGTNSISCGVACDRGQFDFFDASDTEIILRIHNLSGECEDDSSIPFDRNRWGSVFLLERTDDATCADWVMQRRW